jgi:hypothetical protein
MIRMLITALTFKWTWEGNLARTRINESMAHTRASYALAAEEREKTATLRKGLGELLTLLHAQVMPAGRAPDSGPTVGPPEEAPRESSFVGCGL